MIRWKGQVNLIHDHSQEEMLELNLPLKAISDTDIKLWL